MRVFTIRRGNKCRTIYAPDAAERKELRALIPALDALLAHERTKHCLHGFRPGRSPTSNATAHKGKRWSVCFDIAGFFDSVTVAHLAAAGIPAELIAQITVNGAPRQGLPTSPAAANLAACPMDREILRWLARDRTAVYTRYADDLTISTDDRRTVDAALAELPAIVARCGFQIAKHKTHVYDAAAGRRMITGLAVDQEIHPTRAAKRRLRAARHQGNTDQAAGLAEWCRCKLPQAMRRPAEGRRVNRQRTTTDTEPTSPPQPRRTITRRKETR